MKNLFAIIQRTCFSLLLVMFGYSISYGQVKVSPKSAIIANESSGSLSKFEVDLICCNGDLKTAGNVIWLSIKSNSTSSLYNGRYKYTSLNLNERNPFQFSGSVKSGSENLKIVDGYFDIKTNRKQASIVYVLKLESGKTVSGKYKGEYKPENRRKV